MKPPTPAKISVRTGVVIFVIAIVLMAVLFRAGLWIATALQHALLGGR